MDCPVRIWNGIQIPSRRAKCGPSQNRSDVILTETPLFGENSILVFSLSECFLIIYVQINQDFVLQYFRMGIYIYRRGHVGNKYGLVRKNMEGWFASDGKCILVRVLKRNNWDLGKSNVYGGLLHDLI